MTKVPVQTDAVEYVRQDAQGKFHLLGAETRPVQSSRPGLFDDEDRLVAMAAQELHLAIDTVKNSPYVLAFVDEARERVAFGMTREVHD